MKRVHTVLIKMIPWSLYFSVPEVLNQYWWWFSFSGSSAGGVLEMIGLPEQQRGATLVIEMATGYSNLLYVYSDLIPALHAPLFCHALRHHIQMCTLWHCQVSSLTHGTMGPLVSNMLRLPSTPYGEVQEWHLVKFRFGRLVSNGTQTPVSFLKVICVTLHSGYPPFCCFFWLVLCGVIYSSCLKLTLTTLAITLNSKDIRTLRVLSWHQRVKCW